MTKIRENTRKYASAEQREQAGYQVVTNLISIGSEQDPECNEGYLINEALPPLIKAGKNPGVMLLFAPPLPARAAGVRAPAPSLAIAGAPLALDATEPDRDDMADGARAQLNVQTAN